MGKEIELATKSEVVETVVDTETVTSTENTPNHEAVEVEEKKEDISNQFEDFEFGDLCIACSCGHVEPFIKGIEGIRVDLPATNKHELVIVCSKCKHSLKLFYTKSENVDELKRLKEERLNVLKEEQEIANKSNSTETNNEDGSGDIEKA